MGHSRPHRRTDEPHQIWPGRADPELSPPDGSGFGHRDTRADRAGTPDGWVRHRLHGPCGDGKEALEPREHAYAYHAGEGATARRRCRYRRGSGPDTRVRWPT